MLQKVLDFLGAFIEELVSRLRQEYQTQEPTQSTTSPVATSLPVTPTPMPTSVPAPVNPDILLPWNTTDVLSHANFHNVRVICDLEGLDGIASPNGSFTLKDELCATVWGESEFKVHVVHPNYVFNKKTGAREVSTTDYGIAQWNDWFHGKEITPDEANNDPEKAIRLMCKYFRNGLQNQWCAHSNGSYKQYLFKKL